MQFGAMPSPLSLRLLWLLTGGGHSLEKLLLGVRPWWATSRRNGSEGDCFNKLDFRDSGGGGADFVVALATRLGDEGKGKHRVCVRMRLDSHQGSSSAYPGSALTAAFFSSSSIMVEGRPLPPSTSVMVSSGRRPKVIFNLQAVMPLRRPLSYGAAGSRLPVPSGVVPGDVEVGCIELWISHTGEGAGSNCVPLILLRVLGASCKGWCVISTFPVALSVKCTSVDL